MRRNLRPKGDNRQRMPRQSGAWTPDARQKSLDCRARPGSLAIDDVLAPVRRESAKYEVSELFDKVYPAWIVSEPFVERLGDLIDRVSIERDLAATSRARVLFDPRH